MNYFYLLPKYKSAFILILFLLLFKPVSFAQNNDPGSWTMFFSQIRVHEKWSIHAEAQYRDFGIFNETEQLLLRGGINYHTSAQSFFSAGYGRAFNYPNDNDRALDPITEEDRIWEQFVSRNNMGRCYFEHRYRLEQRFIKSKANNRYLDRIRYALRVTIPLNQKEMKKNAVFLTFYDELFIHFTNVPFDRNRLYGAIGYQFSPLANIQLGYLAQTVNITTKQYIQAALFYNFDFRKKE